MSNWVIHIVGGKLGVKTSSVDVVISLVETPGHHTSVWLLEVARVLKPGGDFLVQEPLLSKNATLEEQRVFSKSFVHKSTKDEL